MRTATYRIPADVQRRCLFEQVLQRKRGGTGTRRSPFQGPIARMAVEVFRRRYRRHVSSLVGCSVEDFDLFREVRLRYNKCCTRSLTFEAGTAIQTRVFFVR